MKASVGMWNISVFIGYTFTKVTLIFAAHEANEVITILLDVGVYKSMM